MSTPASMALARVMGMDSTARAKGRHRPAMITSAAATRNAPTATAKPPAGAPVLASSATPGVDPAMAMGMRIRSPSQIASTP